MDFIILYVRVYKSKKISNGCDKIVNKTNQVKKKITEKQWGKVMYKPTEREKNNCIQIVKDILKLDNDYECEKYVDEIFRITYSIGGDYSKETLRSIAEVVLKDV